MPIQQKVLTRDCPIYPLGPDDRADTRVSSLPHQNYGLIYWWLGLFLSPNGSGYGLPVKMELVAIILLGILIFIVTFLWQRISTAKSTKQIPEWDKKPADFKLGDLGEALSTSSLGEFLIQKHNGGKRPVTSFWWRDKRVVSVCTPRAFKETAHIYEHIFEPCFEPLHGAWSIQSLNGNQWKERKNLLHKTVREENLEEFFPNLVHVAQGTAQGWPTGTDIEIMPVNVSNEP